MKIINKKEINKCKDLKELQKSKETKFIVTAFYKGSNHYIEKVMNLIKLEAEKVLDS